MRRLILCLTAVLPLALTAACGQKGPLYLPPRNGTVVTRPAGSVPAAPQATGAQQSGNKSDKDNSQTPPKSP